MLGIRIEDQHPRGFLSFDLKEILQLIEAEIVESEWTLFEVEATVLASPNLQEICDLELTVSNSDLLKAAINTLQVIDGIFSANCEGLEWLRIEAIDSSYWLIFSDSEQLLRKLENEFEDVHLIDS